MNIALQAAHAAVAYDAAVAECAGDPNKMSSYCTAAGETLDRLYLNWITLARAAIKQGQVPAATEDAADILRDALQEFGARTDGTLAVLADRLRHVGRDKRAQMAALESRRPATAEVSLVPGQAYETVELGPVVFVAFAFNHYTLGCHLETASGTRFVSPSGLRQMIGRNL